MTRGDEIPTPSVETAWDETISCALSENAVFHVRDQSASRANGRETCSSCSECVIREISAIVHSLTAKCIPVCLGCAN